MHLFDIIVSVFFSYIVMRGYFRGLLREAFNLFGICGGGLIAVRFSPALANFFQDILGLSSGYGKAIAFSLIWIFVYMLMFFCGMLLQYLVKLLLLGWVDRLGGVVFGLLKSFFIVGLIVISLFKFPIVPKYREEVEKTVIVRAIAEWTPRIYNQIIDVFSWSRFETFEEMLKK
ncbi:MAG: CvpA family protein [bacterium]